MSFFPFSPLSAYDVSLHSAFVESEKAPFLKA